MRAITDQFVRIAGINRGSFPLVLAIAAILCGCTPSMGDTPTVSRATAIRVANNFLRAAANQDSLLLSKIADQKVVAIALQSDVVSISHLRAAAGTTHRIQTTTYEDGADVVFDYVVHGVRYRALVVLHVRVGELKVSRYGLPAKID